MRSQLDLLKFQINCLVYPIYELIDTCIYRRQNGGLLINLELELCQQILIERILRRLDLIEQLHDFSLACVCRLILLLGLFNNLIGQFAISTHKLVSHSLKLLLF
jgi:hypothetical protein